MSKKAADGKKGAGRRKQVDEQMPSDDEVDAFHKSKDRLALNLSDDDEEDSESGSDGDEGLKDGGDLLGLSDDDESDESDESDDDESADDDDEDEDGNGRLAQRELIIGFLSLHVERYPAFSL